MKSDPRMEKRDLVEEEGTPRAAELPEKRQKRDENDSGAVDDPEDSSVISPMFRQATVPMGPLGPNGDGHKVDDDGTCIGCGKACEAAAGDGVVPCRQCGKVFHRACLSPESNVCSLCETLSDSRIYGGTLHCGASVRPIKTDVAWLSAAQTTPEKQERFRRNVERLAAAETDPRLDDAACLSWDGDREENQDVAFVSEPGARVKLFCVLDGHGVGGQMAARFGAEELVRRCVMHRLQLEDAMDVEAVEASMQEAFRETQASLLQLLNVNNLECGTTAVVGQMVNDWLLVANVGDSRAILVRRGETGWSSRALSDDHSFSRLDECQRILDTSKGEIVLGAGNMMRIVPGGGFPRDEIKRQALALAMTRALGHPVLSRYGVSTEPEFSRTQLLQNDRIIIASDGLWDVMPNEEASLMCSYRNVAGRAVSALLQNARERYQKNHMRCGRADNTTILVAYCGAPSDEVEKSKTPPPP